MAGYLSPQQNWNNMMAQNKMANSASSGYLQGQSPQPGQDPNQAPPDQEQLAQLARSNEASFMTSGAMQPVGADIKSILSTIDPSTVNASWVQGFRMALEDKRANAATNINLQTQAAGNTDRQEKRVTDQGMVNAAKAGGFNGVIDYLTTHDPDRAIQFTNAKIEMDNNMMKSEVMRSMLPAQKAEAMVAGYGILGKMGSALLKAAPEERQKMYETMMPIVKTVNPEAPNDVNSAVPMFLLSVSQSTPENILYGNKTQSDMLKGKVGDAILGKSYLLSKGFAPDSPEVKAYDNVLNEGGVDAQRLELQKARLLLNQQQSIQNKINSAKTAFTKIQNDYIDDTRTYNNALSLYNDPVRGPAQYNSLVSQVVRASGDKTLSDKDKLPFQNSAGPLAGGYKWLMGLVGENPGGVDQEWDALKGVAEGYYKQAGQTYQQKIQAWAEAQRAAGIPETTIQDMMKEIHIGTSNKQLDLQLQNVDPNSEQYLQLRAKQAINNGEDPIIVQKKLEWAIGKLKGGQ